MLNFYQYRFLFYLHILSSPLSFTIWEKDLFWHMVMSGSQRRLLCNHWRGGWDENSCRIWEIVSSYSLQLRFLFRSLSFLLLTDFSSHLFFFFFPKLFLNVLHWRDDFIIRKSVLEGHGTCFCFLFWNKKQNYRKLQR